MTKTTTLALDLGQQTGWAYRLGAELVSGSVSFKGGKFDGPGMRFVKFRRFLNTLHAAWPIGQVAFEGVRRHLGVDAAHAYGGYMAHLQSWCDEQEPQIPYEGVPVQAIKIFACGKGNAKKEAVIAAIVELGYRPVDDNEADAIALLLYVGGL